MLGPNRRALSVRSQNFLLVTGATGQIGRAVVRRCLNDNYNVRILARDKALATKLFEGLNVDIVVANLDASTDFASILTDITHICHCAARVGDWGPASEYWQTNVYAFKTMLDACNQNAKKLQRFVHISSLGVYEPRDHFGTTEEEPIYKDGLDAYNQTKAISEDMVLKHDLVKKVGVIVLRPGFVYGPGDRHVLPSVIETLRNRKFVHFDHGQHKLDNVSVFNVAEAVALALASKSVESAIFNITDKDLVTRKIFVETIADMMKLPRPVGTIPRSLGRNLAYLCDGFGRLLQLKKPPLLSKARYKFLALNLEFSIEKAKKQLGYKGDFSFEDGMRSAVDWYKKESAL
jgi:nucleoside-diphosphate-sugar epimerase